MPRRDAAISAARTESPKAKGHAKNSEPDSANAEMVVEKPRKVKKINGGDLPFEATLWSTADQLRGAMDASEYKHVVLGLIFLKYISDAFEERHAELQKEKHADPEDRDEYAGANVFWVPKKARWPHLQANAKQAEIAKISDEAMLAIEKDNPQLK